MRWFISSGYYVLVLVDKDKKIHEACAQIGFCNRISCRTLSKHIFDNRRQDNDVDNLSEFCGLTILSRKFLTIHMGMLP